MTNAKRKVISKWVKNIGGQEMEQVVYLTPIGKKNGKMRFHSQTKHEQVA